ncbi:MAG: sigma-70 family RNA polymerase sigma factor [Bacteroidota bacterium]
MKQGNTNEIVEHLFRHESGHIISRLSARYGMVHLSEIEDAVSEALIRALKTWSIKDVPESPAAWLYSVASRILIDVLRRKQLYFEKVSPQYKLNNQTESKSEDEYATIKLMLWCAHPDLNSKDQLGLMLQLVSGFSIKEISSALLMSNESTKKRLQRARAKLKKLESQLLLPNISDVEDRFPILRSAIYLGFNEGYYSVSHNNILREDLIFESLRLAHLLCSTPHSDRPISQALMGLMLYHTSRIPARRSMDNTLILLEDQDRSLWDRKMIMIANEYMEKAMTSNYYTPYHIEAIIAGIHTQTKDYESTNWKTIAALYGRLTEVQNSPIIKLNYCFALLKSLQIHKAIEVIAHITPDSLGIHKYLYYAVCSNLEKERDNVDQQKLMLWKAVDSAPNDATRKILKERLLRIESVKN